MLKFNTLVRITNFTEELNGRMGRIVGVSGDYPVLGKMYLVQSIGYQPWTDFYGYPVTVIASSNLEVVPEVVPEQNEDDFQDYLNSRLYDDDLGSDDEIL